MMEKLFSLWIFISLLLFLFWGVFEIKKLGYGVTYQSSSSMPKGFYFVEPVKQIHRLDRVLFYPPEKFLKFAKYHHWIPHGGLLMKYVMAMPGDMVCKKNGFFWIRHRKIGKVYRYYAPQKLLPSRPFCGILKNNQYLLVSTKNPHSFDSRYFGPIDRQSIIGTCRKVTLQ